LLSYHHKLLTILIENVEGALWGIRHVSEHMGIDHRGFHVFVPEKTLHFPDVYTVLEQMRCDTVPERMNRRMLRDTSLFKCIFNSSLNGRIADMITPCFAAPWINRNFRRREDILPYSFSSLNLYGIVLS